MNNFFSKSLCVFLLLLICTCCIGQPSHINERSVTQKLNISAASFKPGRISNDIARVVSESNGCYSDVNYSGVDLPVNAFITAIEPRIFVGNDQFETLDVVFSVSSFPDLTTLVNQQMMMSKGYNSQLIQLEKGYVVNDEYALWLNFPNLFSDQIMLCGVVIHYIQDGDVIFRNGFD